MPLQEKVQEAEKVLKLAAETGEQVMKLWLGENPKQIDMFDLLEQEGDK